MSHLRRCPKKLVVQERYIYHAELEQCPLCGQPLQLSGYYHSRKTVQQLGKVVYVASRPKVCTNPECATCGKPHLSVRAQSVALRYCSYGLDVVAQIGWWRDQERLNGDEIHRRLQGQVQIGRREVDVLLHQYRLLLACAEWRQPERLAQAVAEYGGLILHLDGLEPEGAQEQLWTVRELFSTRVLVAGWLPRVNEATLTQLLTPVRDYLDCHDWPVLATLSDKQRVLVNVLQTMWSGAPHQWCQGHYLRNAADPLYDYDHALKTDLRRDVRRTIRRSLSQVAAQAQQGDFAPQLVTGLVVGERPLLAEAQSTPAAGSPTVADTLASTLSSACAAETTSTPVEQPVEPVPAPCRSLLPAGAAPSTAPAAEKPSPTAAEVIQRYAQVIQQALARDGRAPWFLAGLALYDDLQAIADSLARCLQVRPDPYLQLWRATLDTQVQPYAPAFEVVRQAQAWIEAVRQVLDEAPLPTPDAPGPGSAEVARSLAFTLGRIADQSVTDPWLLTFRQHLLDLSERYWSGLFHCYDILGLPRTNNELEGLYGQTKRQTRRQSGLRQIRQPLQRHGAWLLYRSRDRSSSELHAHLAQVPPEVYRAERARWQARQKQFRQRYRWRHNRAGVLAKLEQAWASGAPDSS